MIYTAKDLAKAETERKRQVRRLKGIKARKKALRPGRLKGKALEWLRFRCFLRDNWRCVECGTLIGWGALSRDVPLEIEIEVCEITDWEPVGEMAHIRSRGAGGTDTLDNVRTLCPSDHRLEHNGGKPVKKKERA